jgi:hypothetical protein
MFPVRAARPAYSVSVIFISVMIFCDDYQLCSFPTVCYFHWGPDILLGTLLSRKNTFDTHTEQKYRVYLQR